MQSTPFFGVHYVTNVIRRRISFLRRRTVVSRRLHRRVYVGCNYVGCNYVGALYVVAAYAVAAYVVAAYVVSFFFYVGCNHVG